MSKPYNPKDWFSVALVCPICEDPPRFCLMLWPLLLAMRKLIQERKGKNRKEIIYHLEKAISSWKEHTTAPADWLEWQAEHADLSM